MAETVHLKLKANGADIQGESTQTSLGREGTIECVFWEQASSTVREKGSTRATGRRTHNPTTFRKRVDKSTPAIFDAMCKNMVIEAEFMFFRPNPAGDGTTEHFYTVKISQARIASWRTVSPDCLDTESANDPMLEEVQIVFHTISLNYIPDAQEVEDTWDANQ